MIYRIHTGRNIRTSYDMVPVTAWLNANTSIEWKWVVSSEWIPDWGQPMIIEFKDPVSKDFVTMFRLVWG